MKILELILIIFVLLNLYFILDKYFFVSYEDFAIDNEALANISSLYNNSNMTVSNMTVTQNANIAGTSTAADSVIMSTQDLGGPGVQTRINRQGIIFGGDNNGREGNSAQISAGRHEANSLCIVGMSDTNAQNRKITMWSEGGSKHHGPMQINGATTVNGSANITGNLTIGGWTITDNNGRLEFWRDNDRKWSFSADGDMMNFKYINFGTWDYGGNNSGRHEVRLAPRETGGDGVFGPRYTPFYIGY